MPVHKNTLRPFDFMLVQYINNLGKTVQHFFPYDVSESDWPMISWQMLKRDHIISEILATFKVKLKRNVEPQ